MQEQIQEMKQLLAAPLRQGVQQRELGVRRLQAAIRGHRDRRVVQVSVAQEQAVDTQELLAPLVVQSPRAQATDAQRVQAASRLQAVIRGRYQLVTAYLWDGCDWLFWRCYARRLREDTSRFDHYYRHQYLEVNFTSTPQKFQWRCRSNFESAGFCLERATADTTGMKMSRTFSTDTPTSNG